MIRFQRPQLPAVDAVAAYFAASENARWYSNGGPCHELLVERLEARLGPVHVAPLANCTLGISLALRALVHPGPASEVLLPSFTFAATATAVVWAGLRPVFVDVDPDHWMLDPALLERAIAQRPGRVAAVLSVATFGGPVPLDVGRRWEAIAADAGVPLIVDSAAGLGASDASGVPTGRLGDAEVFSMHATKPFAVGEGGVVCSRHAHVIERVRRLANFGFEQGSVTEPGVNAKLAEWPCATALAVLDRIDDTLASRRRRAASIVAGVAGTGCRAQRLDADPTWQFVPLMAADRRQRDVIMAALRESDVEARTYFDPPLHEMPAFATAERADDLACTVDLAGRAVSLPMANDLSAVEGEQISAAVRRAVESV